MNNLIIFDAFAKASSVLKADKKMVVSISGGADSDIVLDMLHQLNVLNNIDIVWFDTGLEYQATKDHLNYLEEKYNIEIVKCKAIKPIPTACREYGQPFLSKALSEKIDRLQQHNFKWEDKSFEELWKEYPNCKASLRWWCNDFGENSKFNIDYTKGLKEFLTTYPPTFKISNKCCTWAKKKVAHKFNKENNIEISITGIRKAEGGARSTSYKSCFDDSKGTSEYRPIFWFQNKDKVEYEEIFNVIHSKCYSQYGLKRTGCAGCPFGRDFEKELEIIKEYEPKLYIAVNNIFKDSYEYTRKFYEFRKQLKNRKD